MSKANRWRRRQRGNQFRPEQEDLVLVEPTPTEPTERIEWEMDLALVRDREEEGDF